MDAFLKDYHGHFKEREAWENLGVANVIRRILEIIIDSLRIFHGEHSALWINIEQFMDIDDENANGFVIVTV